MADSLIVISPAARAALQQLARAGLPTKAAIEEASQLGAELCRAIHCMDVCDDDIAVLARRAAHHALAALRALQAM